MKRIGALALMMFCLTMAAQADYTGYYDYYKVKPGDTVASVAAKHGVAPNAIVAMNPALASGEKQLSDMHFLCVPKQDPPAPVAKKKRKPAPKPEPEEDEDDEVAAEPTRETVTDEELEYLAEMATKKSGHQRTARVNLGHVNKVISSDGRVTIIPSARPKLASLPKAHRKVLASRQGRRIHALLKSCRSYMGVPYVWGGESPGGFDCSGYVQYVFSKHGVRLPRTADIQFNVGERVKRGQERPGDLVFFETYAPGASHVGVYLGNDYFIHASSAQGAISVSSLREEFFSERYLGARRNL
ncbi:MAG: NlpC/P60 family protein [Vulcanimicrobiota bacterium]